MLFCSAFNLTISIVENDNQPKVKKTPTNPQKLVGVIKLKIMNSMINNPNKKKLTTLLLFIITN